MACTSKILIRKPDCVGRDGKRTPASPGLRRGRHRISNAAAGSPACQEATDGAAAQVPVCYQQSSGINAPQTGWPMRRCRPKLLPVQLRSVGATRLSRQSTAWLLLLAKL